MKYTETLKQSLNTILEKNYAATKGYKTASENTEETELKNFFLNQSKQRETFTETLKKELVNFGFSPKESTDFTSDMHRTWMNVKDFFASNEEAAVLQEVIRGEENAVEAYNSILGDKNIPSTTSELIRKQRDVIINNIERLRNFELQEA